MSNPVELVGGIAIGTGVGAAVGATVTPKLQEYLNEQWAKYPNKPPSVGTLASGVAQGQVAYDDALAWARASGFDKPQFDALIDIANVGPGGAFAFELWRRNVIQEPGFRRALKRLGLEQEWIDDLTQIKDVLLTPAELAVMIQRTVVPNPDILPNQPSTAGSNVPPMPVVNIDVLKEAEGSGTSPDRLKAKARIIGLPASPDLAARMHFRGLITEGAYNQAILEGNTRGEWAPFLLDGFRDIPTSHTFVEGRLRGWLTDAEMYAGTRRHGMSQEDTHLDFLVSGRPLSWHQVFLGIRRGGVYDGPTTDIAPPFLKALKESNIRPEWYHIAWHLRFSYPSGFMIRGAVTSGDLTPHQGNDILFELGWDQKWIDVFVKAWSGGVGTAGKEQTKTELLSEYAGGYVSPDELRALLEALGYSGVTLEREIHLADARRNASMRERVVKVIGDAYRAHAIDSTAATAELAEANVLGDAATMLIALWDKERRFTVRELSDTQVAKAGSHRIIDPAVALAELQSRGYSAEDAQHLIDLAP